jgi:hypothetical protein
VKHPQFNHVSNWNKLFFAPIFSLASYGKLITIHLLPLGY